MAGSLGLVASEDEARRRLARDLHDDHCQRIAALGFKLRALRNRLDEGDPRRLELEGLGRELGELGTDLRRLSHDLHPAILERRGLLVALRDRAAELQVGRGLRVELDLPANEPALAPEVSLALYRIAREALANTVKHSRATVAQVSLRVARGKVRLKLEDNGAGFGLEAARRSEGLGLASIEERTHLLGGRCRIHSAPAAGTTLEVLVPRRRLSRWVRRHGRGLAAAVLVLLALGVGLAATLLQARRTAAEAQRAEAAVSFLEDLFTAADPRRERGEVPDARELLSRGRKRLERDLSDQPLLRARLLDTLGKIHGTLGLYAEARPLLEEALAIRERLEGPDHPEVRDTLLRLGWLAHLARKEDAEPLLRRALTLAEKHAQREPEALAKTLNDLGSVLAAAGKFDQAEPTLRRALALYERLFGKEDLRVAKVLHNLSGIAYYRSREEPARLAEAEALLRRALSIRERSLPADDLELAGSREALALLRRGQKQPAEAAELLEAVVLTSERIYGPDHPELARALLNLGLARTETGEFERAGALLSRAWSIFERRHGPEHKLTVKTLADLAYTELLRQRYAEAEPLYRRLLELKAKGALGPDWARVEAQWAELQTRNRLTGSGAKAHEPASGPSAHSSTAPPPRRWRPSAPR